MLKMRLKRNGRKRQPSYRVVIMENTTRREGRPVDQIGFYNSITKDLYLNEKKVLKWLSYGVQPTNTVFRLLMLKYRRQISFRFVDRKVIRAWLAVSNRNQNIRKHKPRRWRRDRTYVWRGKGSKKS